MGLEIPMTMRSPRKWITTLIALGVAALHLVTGESYRGPFPLFVNGYMIDILLTMTLVLLLGLVGSRLIRSALFRGVAVFGFGCFVEASQYFGRPFFGSTFDPLDILAYAAGVTLGLLLDLIIFPRLFREW